MPASSCVDGWSKLKLDIKNPWGSNLKILFDVSFPPSSVSPVVPFDIFAANIPGPIDSVDVIRKMQTIGTWKAGCSWGLFVQVASAEEEVAYAGGKVRRERGSTRKLGSSFDAINF
jgi:hypothetical protein